MSPELEYGDNEYQGLSINIVQDEDSESPREWDNLGTMYCEHNRYTLGDKDADDIRDENNGVDHYKGIVLPLYLYDHSGLSMSTGAFSCPWDSGQVGYIYITDAAICQEFSVKRISKKRRELITEYLRQEVKAYDQYLRGDVYGFIVTNSNGEHIDSCFGFYGLADVSLNAIASADYHLAKVKQARETRLKTWIRNHVPLESRVQ